MNVAVFTGRADAEHAWRQALERVAQALYGAGWVAAKVLYLALTALGAVFFAAGWVARRSVPAGRWVAAAVALGWESAAPPGKRGRNGA